MSKDTERFKLAVESKNIDAALCAMLGVDKMTIRIEGPKDHELKVGDEYWYMPHGTMSIDKLTITYIRSGVVFYVADKDKNKEDYFGMGCLMQKFMEPVKYESDLDPEYYNIIATMGKTTITYKKKQ